jgi:hypothetical protein
MTLYKINSNAIGVNAELTSVRLLIWRKRKTLLENGAPLMAAKIPPPTLELQARICAFIRTGAYPNIAAQAAGVPADRLDMAAAKHPKPKYVKFARPSPKLAPMPA